MNEGGMKMNYLIQAFIRGIGPLIVMSLISLLMKNQGKAPQEVKGVFVAGLIMTVVAAASVLYEIEGWSFKKQLIVHHLAMLVTVYPLLLVSGWFKVENWLDALIVLGIFLLIGLAIIAGFFIYFTFIKR